jgi:hypothetical protein
MGKWGYKKAGVRPRWGRSATVSRGQAGAGVGAGPAPGAQTKSPDAAGTRQARAGRLALVIPYIKGSPGVRGERGWWW